MMRSFEVKAMIHSKEAFDKAEIVYQNGYNAVVAKYNEKYYTAVFNPFRQCYYIDDIYGEVSKDILRNRGIII